MWEDIEAECIRTIERDAVDDSFRLSRRHRWKPLAVDVHGADAVVLVATRGKRRGGQLTARHYGRRDGSWVGGGSGGGGGEDRTLPSRPVPDEGWFQTVSHGMTVDQEMHRLLRSKRVHHLVVQVAEGVVQVQWRGRRRAVADHGFVCVVWRGRATPTVEKFDLGGERVGEVGRGETRSPLHRMPWRARIRYVASHRFHRGEWFNYSPRGR